MSRGLRSVALFVLFVVVVALGRHVALGPTSTTSTTTSTTTTSSTTTTGLPACQGSDFTAVDDGGEGAAGTVFDAATLTKITPGDCTVNGYPLLTAQDGTGGIVATTVQPASTSLTFPQSAANAPASALTVASGSSIGFSYSFSDNSAGPACPSLRTLNVGFAVNQSVATITLKFPATLCGNGAVAVSPFYALSA